MTTFRRLPAASFETLPSDTEPVTLRRLVRDGQTWFYAVNASPWAVKLELELSQSGVRPMELSGLRLVPAPAGTNWKFDLQPYDLLAFRLPGEISFRQSKVEYPRELRPELEQRIAQLRERRLRLENPPALTRLVNADLEQTVGNGQPLGWQINTRAARHSGLDQRRKPTARRQAQRQTPRGDRPRRNAPQRPLRAAANRTARASLWVRSDAAASAPGCASRSKEPGASASICASPKSARPRRAAQEHLGSVHLASR